MEKINAVDMASSGISRGVGSVESVEAHGYYKVTCVGADGQVKWEDEINNLVTTVGKNYILDNFFNSVSFTPAWYLGLVDGASTPTYATGDTLASHTGWSEFLNYSGSNRVTPTWNSASSGSKSTNAAAFAITSSGGTVAGCLLCSTQARNTSSNGGAGVLYSVGAFSAGNKIVTSGDTLNVTYTASV